MPKTFQVVLVALPGVDLNAVEAELSKQCDALPRNETARKALKHSYAIRVAGQQEAIEFSNEYAPEHLIVNVEDAESWLPALDNAGECVSPRSTLSVLVLQVYSGVPHGLWPFKRSAGH